MKLPGRRRGWATPGAWGLFIALATLATLAVLWVGWRFNADLQQARAAAARGSLLAQTPCGQIEYQQAGAGLPLLVVHGSGGGHDQGMAFAAGLAGHGVRVIAMSRFGYLRTPMPADASALAQARAHVCLLDALDIAQVAVMGGSAGALSALQLAIHHPERVRALILLVPLAYKPPTQADSAPPLPAWVEAAMLRVIGSDFLFWAALQVARDTLLRVVLATPPELLAGASVQEQARIAGMLDHILPVSARAAGLVADTAAGKQLGPSALAGIRMPTLLVSARDDGYGTYASARYSASQIAGARFLGFDHGGHTWLGHDAEVQAAILALLAPLRRPCGHAPVVPAAPAAPAIPAVPPDFAAACSGFATEQTRR